jgi:hypothetical protein
MRTRCRYKRKTVGGDPCRPRQRGNAPRITGRAGARPYRFTFALFVPFRGYSDFVLSAFICG